MIKGKRWLGRSVDVQQIVSAIWRVKACEEFGRSSSAVGGIFPLTVLLRGDEHAEEKTIWWQFSPLSLIL